MKRLLQLFPEIKEIRNWFYRCQTNSCIEQVNQSTLDFKPDDLDTREFLGSEKKVSQGQMVDREEWTGLTNAYLLLQKTYCVNEGQYTVLNLERFLILNTLMVFRTLMQSNNHHIKNCSRARPISC